MTRPIPISLTENPEIEIDATLVADGLGLPVADFRRLMDQGKITQLCERGTEADKGLYRASFYYEGKRVRLVVDAEGHLVDVLSEPSGARVTVQHAATDD